MKQIHGPERSSPHKTRKHNRRLAPARPRTHFFALLICILGVCGGCGRARLSPVSNAGVSAPRNYSFDGAISEEVLNNYLSRAVSHQTLYTDNDDALLQDDIRMFVNTGAKFVGRASIIWSTPADMAARTSAASGSGAGMKSSP